MLKAILMVLGAIIVLNAFVMIFISNLSVGTILIFIIGMGILLNGIFFGKIVHMGFKFLNYAFFLGLISAVGLSLFLMLYGNNRTVTYNEDAVIVLGSGIRGEELTKSLKARLDTAIQYHNKNPEAIIVLSGGQGPQETITESLAMERYMLSQGVPQDKIIKEQSSTSTYENFMFSKELLDEHFSGEYTVAFVTTDYHIYRASRLAKIVGFDNITHSQSQIQWASFVPSYLRECLAVIKLWVFKR